MMRIIQLVHTSIQFEPPTFALGRLLADRGHQVRCIGYWLPGLPHEEEVSSGFKLVRISRGDYAYLPRLIRGGIRFVSYWKGSASAASTFDPDIVIAYGYDVLPIASSIVRSRNRIVYYCTEYSPRPRLKQFLIGWGFLKHVERRYVQRIGYLVSVEPNRAKLQEQQWNRGIDQIILNAPLYDQTLEQFATSQLFQKHNGVRLVYAGSIGARNCLIKLMEAVMGVPGVSLDIYGRVNPDYQKRFHENLHRFSAMPESCVMYHGPVEYDSLARLLTEYDVGVSLYDGRDTNTRFASPAKLFEYMRSGLALISTPQPTPSKIVQDSSSGFLVDLAAPDQLSVLLQDLVQRPRILRQMRLNAVRAFRVRYAYERQATALLEHIEQMEAAGR